MKKILVVGSLNMDFVLNVDKMPKKGETVFGKKMELVPGGKGANQAYTIGKLGGKVSMIGAIGKDVYGEKLIVNLNSVGVNTSGIAIIEDEPTGNAFITVDVYGENSIIAIPGANNSVTKELIDQHMYLIDECDILVMQLEIPLEIVEYVASIAKSKGKLVILDPAPAPQNLPEKIMQHVDIMKPNETELQTLTGLKIDKLEDVVEAAKLFVQKGVKVVLVTLGAKGTMMVTKEQSLLFEGEKVVAVDSTAAGDCFTAAFTIALTQGKTYEQAITFGNKVSAIAVTRKGAQTSIPSASEVKNIIIKD